MGVDEDMGDIKHFALQRIGLIRDVSVDFGDLTFLVGSQASGKIQTEEMFLPRQKMSSSSVVEEYSR